MILKIVKVIGIKLVYILFFTVLLVFVGACFFKTFNRYFMAFSLSEEVNRYLESVSLEELKIAEANRIIGIIHPTDAPSSLPSDLADPFASLPEPEAEEE